MLPTAETIGIILCKIILNRILDFLFLPAATKLKKERRRSFQIMHFVFCVIKAWDPRGIHLVIANITLS